MSPLRAWPATLAAVGPLNLLVYVVLTAQIDNGSLGVRLVRLAARPARTT